MCKRDGSDLEVCRRHEDGKKDRLVKKERQAVLIFNT